MADDTLPLFPLEDWKKYRVRRGFGSRTKRSPGLRVTICAACGVAYYPYFNRQLGCSARCSTVLMFWKNVEKTDTCWLWIGKKLPAGYGQIGTRDHKHILVHRLSYELHKGPIPEGLHIDHLCRMPACVNPDHLEAVTAQENILRGKTHAARNKDKTHCDRGHLFDDANTYWAKNGAERICRACKTLLARKYYAAKKQRE